MEGRSAEHPATLIARIAARREHAGESLDTLPEDPAGVIAWVIAHPHVPRSVLREDVLDCLTLDRWLRVTLNRRELALFEMARGGRAGEQVTWAQIAGCLGLQSPQGAQQRYDRLCAWRQDSRKDEKEQRERRQTELREETWLDAHAGAIGKAAAAFVAVSPDGAPELAEELEAEAGPRNVMVWLRLATQEHSPGLCPAAEDLVAEWEGLGK